MKVRDTLFRNEKIMADLRKTNPVAARDLMQDFRAEYLVKVGMCKDLDEAIAYLKKLRSNRTKLDRCREASDYYVGQLTDEEYHGFMRMSRARFNSMAGDLEQYFKDKNINQRSDATPTRFQLAGVIRWLAGGSPHDIIFFCGLRYRTFRRMRWRVLEALHEMYFDKYIKLPTTSNEREELSHLFEEKNGVKGCLGAIDGLLVHINLPSNVKNARKFRCYKAYYALNCQAVAGPNAEFLYINIAHAGATGDGEAARRSNFWQRCEKNEFNYKEGYFYIGDAAYSLLPWMITPYQGTYGVNSPEDVFNLQLSRSRQSVERAFGIMIKRWRILVRPLEFGTVEQSVKVIKACALLHNICTEDTVANKKNDVIASVDVARHPFDPKDPTNGVVPRIRLHVDDYVDPTGGLTTAERRKEAEKQLRKEAVTKRNLIAGALRDLGYRRKQRRGCKRGAAYQMT